MLYQAYQTQSDLMSPFRLMAQAGAASFWLAKTEGSMLRKLAASFDVFSRLRLTHTRPAYGIQHITVGEHQIPVTEHKLLELPFGTLLHFKKELPGDLPFQPRDCWSRRCRGTLPRCCARPPARCCKTTMYSSPTGTTRVM